MLCIYGTENGCLIERPEGAASEIPAAIWLDLVEPTALKVSFDNLQNGVRVAPNSDLVVWGAIGGAAS